MRTVRVRRHVRTIKGRVCEIPAHWRHIGDREPDAAPVQRDELTMDLFAFSVRQLKELRADQRDEAKQQKEETETMNARDNAPTLPAIDGAINAAHGLLLKSEDALSADDVAKALAIKKAEASKQLRELHGLGLLENEPRKGGTMYFRMAVAAPVSDIAEVSGAGTASAGLPG